MITPEVARVQNIFAPCLPPTNQTTKFDLFRFLCSNQSLTNAGQYSQTVHHDSVCPIRAVHVVLADHALVNLGTRGVREQCFDASRLPSQTGPDMCSNGRLELITAITAN